MGYEISVSIFKAAPKAGSLYELPKTLPWKLYHSKSYNIFLLDVFNFKQSQNKIEYYPFCSFPSVQDLPLNFEEPLNNLNELYETLRKKNRAQGFKRTIVNLNLIISRIVSEETLTIISDDEGVDLAVISESGNLQKLHFRAGGVEVKCARELEIAINQRKSLLIHRVVTEETTLFLGAELPIFGFDGDIKPLELELVDESPPLPPPPSKPPRGGWAAHNRKMKELKKWWQFWK